jgi:hypothetical protein
VPRRAISFTTVIGRRLSHSREDLIGGRLIDSLDFLEFR